MALRRGLDDKFIDVGSYVWFGVEHRLEVVQAALVHNLDALEDVDLAYSVPLTTDERAGLEGIVIGTIENALENKLENLGRKDVDALFAERSLR